MADKQIKILLVEDDSFLLSMYSTKFELENFNVLIAEDGEKGWKFAQTEDPDVILLDIKLPKMDGFEVLKNIKENKETANIPVILLTNLSQKEDRDKGLEMGADDYLVKAHFMPSEVVGKIKKLIANKKDKE